MTYLNIHKAEIKLNGKLSGYTDSDIYSLVKAQTERRNIDTFEQEEIATAESIERYTANPIIEIEITYPCNRIASVTWAEVAEVEE